MVTEITTPLSEMQARRLRAGDRVALSGVVYGARDMVHKRLTRAIKGGGKLPFDPEGAVIYYVGPTPAPPGRPVGAAGPTTSSRMDPFSPLLMEHGVRATIGKGYRSRTVREAMREFGAVHLAAPGGAAALLSRHIVSAAVIAYEDLGTEALRRFEVVDFPVLVAYDAAGNSVYGPEPGS
jgi:fumarate hydratase subunit beta